MSRPPAANNSLREHCEEIAREEAVLREGGGKAGQDRQHKLGRLFARERIAQLLDKDAEFFEVGLWAAYKMYRPVGQNSRRRCGRWHRQCQRRPMHDHRERRHREGRRVLSADREEIDPRATDGLRK